MGLHVKLTQNPLPTACEQGEGTLLLIIWEVLPLEKGQWCFTPTSHLPLRGHDLNAALTTG